MSEAISSDEECSAFAIYEEQRFVAALADCFLELRDVGDGLMVDFLDDVALLKAGVGHFAGGVDVGDDDALGRRRKVQLLRDVSVQVADFDAFQCLAAAFLVVIRIGLGGFCRHFGQLYGGVALCAVAERLELEFGAWLHHRDAHAELVAVGDGLAVDLENDVACLDARFRCRAVGGDVANDDSLRVLFAEGFGHGWSYVLRIDAEIGAGNVTVLQDLVHNLASEIGRNGKADALAASGTVGDDGSVDADEFAAIIDERAAGISGIDWGVGLEEVFVVLDAETAAACGADDALGDGLANAERIADGQGDVANLDFGGVADGNRREILAVNFQDRDVGFRIGADDACLELALVGERDANVRGAIDYVIVREDIAFGADDYA